MIAAAPDVVTGRPENTGVHPRLGRSVTIDQATRLLCVSRRTVYYWIRDGRLDTIRTLGGSQRVLVESMARKGRRRNVSCRAVRKSASGFP